ncbi:hypothetical protein PsorP6_003018 [Peronosclerospora sorghi]|uniref:Uncharacterized protein n=1 Tax=Peronosclerospora sorghi TaxID=230839 RepID=A0ACC0VNE3_9STRA|nr:hypothetical protein PsorP6_003018 [Peronosclerospora sorghi]
MANENFYAVAVGRSTGVFTSWTECQAQVNGFSGSKYKKFKTNAEAQAFVHGSVEYQQTAKAESMSNGKRAREDRLVLDQVTSPLFKKPRHTSTETCQADRIESELASVTYPKQRAAIGVETSSKVTPPVATSSTTSAASKPLAGVPDPKDPDTLVAFCDGSALRNGHKQCRAGYACIFPHCEEWNVAKQVVEERATNNRAEYMAALEAIKRANVVDPERSRVLYIFSDSMLLIRSMTEWLVSWQKNHWKKSNGASVQNRDLLELLAAEAGGRPIRWTHVKAHTGKNDWKSKWNDVADNAARNAAMGGGNVRT